MPSAFRRRRTLSTRQFLIFLPCSAAVLLLTALLLYFTRPVSFENEFAGIDASDLTDGVISAAWLGEATGRVRLGVQREGGEQYLYELDPGGRMEQFALTEGDGDYTITVYRHIADLRYRPVFSHTLTLKLKNSAAPFLRPNQMVQYESGSAVDALAKELTAGAIDDSARLDALQNHIITRFSYDSEWAEALQSGYIPNLEDVLIRGGGNCLELSALLCAMLRLRGIPCKLTVGWAGDAYHAWVNVFIDGAWVLRDPTFLIGGAEEFTEHAENYRPVFCY